MRVAVDIRYLRLLLVVFASGCGQTGYTVAPPTAGMPPPPSNPQALAGRNQELASRARALDHDNQQLESLLAQSRQQIQLLKDELTAVRDQLRTTNEQLVQVRNENQGLTRRAQAMLASVRRPGNVEIKPNNSLLMNLALKNLPGIQARQDGDVIRVELPADRLFQPGTSRLSSNGTQLLATVTADLLRNYPKQIIGVEGHTERNPALTRSMTSSQHLSLAFATAVYDYLTGPLRVPEGQLFVIGHGANHPVVSNATPAGKARNRRVELVVYPDPYRGG